MTKYDIIPMLLQACPGFRPQWDAYIAGREIPLLVYIDIGEFVSYLVDSYKNGELDAIRPAFEILERLLLEGDSETQECAVIAQTRYAATPGIRSPPTRPAPGRANSRRRCRRRLWLAPLRRPAAARAHVLAPRR